MTRDTTESSSRRLPILLRLCWYQLDRAFGRMISPLEGLTQDQFTVLRILAESSRKHLAQCEIAKSSGFHPNTVTQILLNLEGKRWIQRRPNRDDGRVKAVSITKTGRNVYSFARPIAATLQTSLLAHIPPAERASFLRQLEVLAAACQQADLFSKRDDLIHDGSITKISTSCN